MHQRKILTGSLEDYLESIYHLIDKNNVARVKDLAESLKVRKSSVTVALRTLSEKKLIHYSPYSEISLTTKGRQTAQDIIRRHETLKEFFIDVLGVEEQEADDTACKMEHALPSGVTDRLIGLLEYIILSPGHGEQWIKEFHAFYQQRIKGEIDLSPDTDVKAIALSQLKTGIKAEILSVNHTGPFRKRILEMGVTQGAVLTIERVAPLGDPIDIKIRGYHLSLRKEEAQRILVKELG
jgi:DtxR family transcriptional regulator, Mn-dependent transcriptional regulator